MVTSTHIFAILFQVIDKATKSLAGIEKNMARVAQTMDNATKQVKNFNVNLLGLGLGLTFFMFGIQMQLKRLLRQMFTIFEEAQGSTGALIEKFNIMRANLGALSIAFMEALSQSRIFEILINIVERLTGWFLNLSKAAESRIVTWTLIFLGTSIVLSIIGQILLGIYAIGQAIIFIEKSTIGLNLANLFYFKS